MTDPSQFGKTPEGWPPPPSGYPQPPGYPQPGPTYGAVGGYGGVPGYGTGGGYGPPPGYGFHPVTGEPLSDKSKLVAGLLQLLGLVGVLGVGRMYMGQTGLGVAQLLIGIVITIVTCGVGYLGPIVWGIIDTIVLLTGAPRDQYGRLLRDGA